MGLNISPEGGKSLQNQLIRLAVFLIRPESFPSLNSGISGAPVCLALSYIADGLCVIGHRISLSCGEGSVSSLCSYNNYRVGAGSIQAERWSC